MPGKPLRDMSSIVPTIKVTKYETDPEQVLQLALSDLARSP